MMISKMTYGDTSSLRFDRQASGGGWGWGVGVEWSSVTNMRKLGGSIRCQVCLAACANVRQRSAAGQACRLSKTSPWISRSFKDMSDPQADELGT